MHSQHNHHCTHPHRNVGTGFSKCVGYFLCQRTCYSKTKTYSIIFIYTHYPILINNNTLCHILHNHLSILCLLSKSIHPKTDVSHLGASYFHKFKLHTAKWITSKKKQQQQEEYQTQLQQQQQKEQLEGTTVISQEQLGFEMKHEIAKGK